jgi:hypothetical protein
LLGSASGANIGHYWLKQKIFKAVNMKVSTDLNSYLSIRRGSNGGVRCIVKKCVHCPIKINEKLNKLIRTQLFGNWFSSRPQVVKIKIKMGEGPYSVASIRKS